MNSVANGLLGIIALAACAVAIKLYAGPIEAKCGPTFGDFASLRDIEDAERREAVRQKTVRSLPMIRVQGGSIEAEVTGTVSVEP